MASILTTITGQDILNNVGSQLSYVGRFAATDIDQNITELTPLSESEIAVEWMTDLFTAAGLDATNTTAEKAAWGNRAMLWRCWCFYFMLSRQGEDCPPECKDPERFWELYNRGKKYICDNLTLLGFTDTSGNWCKSDTKDGLSSRLGLMKGQTTFHNKEF